MKQIYTLLIFSLLTVSNILAADIYVSATGSDMGGDGSSGNPYATISQAISVANNNDVIKIVGTISSTTSASISSLVDKSITIEGTDATATITGFSGGSRVLNINTSYTGTVTLRNLIFLNNTSSNNFGGSVLLSNQTGANVNVENCTFKGNSTTADHANNGGGAIAMLNGTLTITNSNFSANTTAGEAGGGAIYVAGTTTSTITGTTFYNNSATNTAASKGRGGAINFNNNDTTNSITNCTFFENKNAQTGNFHGAAIRVNSTSSSTTVSVSNSLFYNNLSESGSGIASDFNGPGQPTMNFTNSLGQYGNNIDSTTGSIINNGGAAGMSTGANISNSNLTWNATENRVEFSAPSSISDNTPIDYGSDNSDVGAWNSKINLFKTGSDWATGSNWSSTAVPTSSENVTLLSDSPVATISGTTGAVCNDLSVNASSSLTVNSGGSLIVNGDSTGNVTYNRALTAVAGNQNGWHLISSPVAGQTYNNAFATANDLATSGTKRGLATYNDANASGLKYTYLENDDSNTGIFTSASGIGYSAKRETTGDISFTGTINTADVATSSLPTGFNLVGNPYTSYVSSQTLLNENANLDQTQIWVWKQGVTGGNFIALTSKADNFVLAPGQGFFVKVNSASVVNFSKANQTNSGDVFQKIAKTELKLLVSDGENNRFAKFYYLDNVTKGFDAGYEGETFGGIKNSFEVFSQLVEDNQGKNYQIQSLPKSELESLIIPIGIEAESGKELTFSLESSNFPSGVKVYLEDRLNNTFSEISQTKNFKITLSEATNDVGRFYLHTSSSALSTDSINLDTISVYSTDNATLRIIGLSQGKSNVKMFNILGKQVLNTSFTSDGVYDVNLPKLTTGIYIVQLENNNGTLNKKIVLE